MHFASSLFVLVNSSQSIIVYRSLRWVSFSWSASFYYGASNLGRRMHLFNTENIAGSLRYLSFYFSRQGKTNHILLQYVHWIRRSALLIWMKINLIEGMLMERKVRNYIQQSSSQWISLMNYETSVRREITCFLLPIVRGFRERTVFWRRY